MVGAVITLSVLAVLAIAGWAWCAVACHSHRKRAEDFQHQYNWLETRHALVSEQLARVRAQQKETQ
ncbi:hypothetical protein [Paraburkholderia sp. C35]|uniref:hypothetical protein n=1 Tax=Paraburkholderia sp. C35 TaxID=2126993 RepID=UPI000D68AA3E|nr:hypothetical protein [Paraburkholderia sp. C35]